MRLATYKPKLYKFIWTVPFVLFYIFIVPPENKMWFYIVTGVISIVLLRKLWRDKPNWEFKQDDIEYRYSQLENSCKDWMSKYQENADRDKYKRYKKLLDYIKDRKQKEINRLLWVVEKK